MAYPSESRVAPPIPDPHRSGVEEPEPFRDPESGAVHETGTDAERQPRYKADEPATDRTERKADDRAERTAEETRDRAPDERPAEPVGPIWGDGGTRGFQERLRDLQLRFVDDPRAAVDEARSLTAEVVDALTVSIGKQRDGLAAGYPADAGDTEELRLVLRRYRQFVERLLKL
jgi:hypothetical protein